MLRHDLRPGAARRGVETNVDLSRALGVSDRPPVDRIDWRLEVDADAPDETLEDLRRSADEHCPGAYCIRNPIELRTPRCHGPQLDSSRMREVTAQASPPAVPHPLPDPLITLIAKRFRVLAEPMRIKLLDELREGPATVGELQERVGASQQSVSKHLGVLLSEGIVSRTKQGTSARYEIADPGVFELCDQVCGGLRRQVTELIAVLA